LVDPRKVKVKRSDRNPDFFEVSGGFDIGNKPHEPVMTMNLDYAKTVAGARVRTSRKRGQGVIGDFEMEGLNIG